MAKRTRRRTTSSTSWRPDRPDCDRFFYDSEAAERAVAFFPRYLVHVKGELADQPLELDEWQKNRIIRPLFGWKRRSDGTRQYRKVLIALPRKNGKSTLASGIGLLCLTADREPGAEVYSAAADREQAAIVFDAAKEMVEASPRLHERITVLKRSLVVRKTRSFYRVLSRDARTKHGQNAHCILFDELHTQRDRELWDTLSTGRAGRRQPLLVAITTAGWDRHSICWEVWDYARKVEQGIIDDPYFLPVIYGIEPSDYPDDEGYWKRPEVWAKANPGLGISVSESYLEEEAQAASESPAAENVFKQLHLNIWTEQAERWMRMDRWDECAGDPIDEEELEGRPCYTALDLSSTLDITAMVHVFPPLPRDEDDREGDEDEEPEPYIILPRFFIPQEGIRERVRRDKVPYDKWVAERWITATPGEVIDNDAILRAYDEDAQRFDILETPYDRWGAREISRELEDRGATVVPFGQGFASMSAPTKELMTLTLQRRIRHGGNPVLRWMASNAAASRDAAGNIKLDKKKSSEKIDGMVALVMALDRALRNEGRKKKSVYRRKRRGLVTL